MFRLLLALLSLLATGLGSTTDGPDASGSHAAGGSGPSSLVLDHSLLPGPDGWFLAPITVEDGGEVRIDLDFTVVDTDGGLSPAALLIARNGTLGAFASTTGSYSTAAQVNLHGALLHGSRIAGGSGGASGSAWLTADVGETLWLGLVAADWEEDSELFLRVEAADGALDLGDVRRGHDVRAVDLVQEARAAGTNARVGDLQVGASGEGVARLSPHGTVLALVDYWANGDARAELDVQAGHRLLVSDQLVQRNVGQAFYAGPGAFEARLDGLDEPYRPYVPTLPHEPSYVAATLLLADVDVPFQGEFVWEMAW